MRVSGASVLRLRGIVAAFLCMLSLGFAEPAHAVSSLAFKGLSRTLTTSLSSPGGIIADSAGNAYIADTGHNQIVEVNPQGVASVLTISRASNNRGYLSDMLRRASRRNSCPSEWFHGG
jgi:hypothetical protein